MDLQKKYFVGKNKPGVWASVYAYKPNNPEVFAKKGEIFASIIISGPKEFDSSVAGNLLLDILHETYFEAESDQVLEALEEAVRYTKSRLISLVENDENAAISGIEFDLVTLVIKDNYFFSVRIGDASIKIYRNGSLQDLAAGYKDPVGEENYQVLSGILQKGDVFLVHTPAVDEAYTVEELLESVSDYSELAIKNKMIEDDSKIGALLVGVGITRKHEDNIPIEDENITNLGDEKEEAEIEEFDNSGETKFSNRKEGVQKILGNIKEKGLSGVDVIRDIWNSKFLKPKEEEGEDIRQEEANIKEKSTIVFWFYRILSKLKIWLIKLGLFIKEDVLAIEPNSSIYLKGRERKLNYRVFIAVFIVLLIFGYVFINIRQNAVESKRIKTENQKLVTDIQSQLKTIENSSVFTINTPDNISGRNNVLTTIESLESKLSSTKIADEYKEDINEVSNKLFSLKSKLLREINKDSIDLVADIGANYEGANLTDITLTGGSLYVSDSARNVIYQVSPQGNVKEFITGNMESPRFLDADPGTSNVIFIDESATALGVFNTQTGQVTRFPGMTSSKFASTVEIDAYQVGPNDVRLYLAMQTTPQIQQISRNGEAYSASPKSRWSGDGFNGIKDLTVLDGKFIVIKEGAGLERYYVNSAITTNVSGLLGSDNLSSANALTSDGLYIYLADSANKRILVFTKSRGENVDFVDLVAQYRYTGNQDAFSRIKDIVVDNVNIYVLDGARIYKLPKSDFQGFVY